MYIVEDCQLLVTKPHFKEFFEKYVDAKNAYDELVEHQATHYSGGEIDDNIETEQKLGEFQVTVTKHSTSVHVITLKRIKSK